MPVAEINLAPGDAVFFEHHVLLWKDERYADGRRCRPAAA